MAVPQLIVEQQWLALWERRESFRYWKWHEYRHVTTKAAKAMSPDERRARRAHWWEMYEEAAEAVETRKRTIARLEKSKPSAASHVSSKGVDLIARFEGFRSKAYKPVAAEQYLTIGYGHYGPDVRPGQTISKSAARDLLKRDVRRFEAAVREHVKVPINQNRFDALVSFCYNVGEGAFRSSSLLRRLNAGDYRGAAAEFGDWVNGASGPLPGLVTRRKAERALFNKRP